MKDWKQLTVENLVRAQCIFVSVGRDYPDIKSPEFLREKHGEYWLERYAQEAVAKVNAGEEYEFIFNIIGSSRCRMFVHPRRDPQLRELFPNAEYLLSVTSLRHYEFVDEKSKVEKRFSRIEKALLKENFPTVKV